LNYVNNWSFRRLEDGTQNLNMAMLQLISRAGGWLPAPLPVGGVNESAGVT
jgi:hypothetical protein